MSNTSTKRSTARKPQKRTAGKLGTSELVSERAKLAHAISTILNSEETPVLLYNCVGDFVTDISTALLDDSPEMIEKALALGEEPLVKKRRVRSAVKGGSHAEQAR